MIQLITSNDTASILCLSPKTLRKWRWEGKGPKFIKVGHKVAYRQEDITTFIQQQSRRSTSDNGAEPP